MSQYRQAGVTSVALSAPSILNVAGSPLTSRGTLALSLASQTQHQVFAAPAASSGTPGFRVLVAGDLPGTIAYTDVSNTFTLSQQVSGNITVGGTESVFSALPDVTANYGLLNLGSAPFDGTTSGFFSGANRTVLAINVPSASFFGNLIDCQLSGTRKFAVDYGGSILRVGNITMGGSQSSYTLYMQLGAPVGSPTGSVAAGGSLVSGTAYFYRVAALDVQGGETTPNTQSSSITPSGGNLSVSLSWTGVVGAAGYRIYRTSVSGDYSSAVSYDVIGATSFTDTGAAGSSGPPLTSSLAYATQISTTVSSPNYVADKATSADYGNLCLGSGPFTSALSNHFTGSSSGTELAINAGSSYTGSLIDAQVAGISKFSVDYTGSALIDGNLTVQGSSGFDYFKVSNNTPGIPSVAFTNELFHTGPVYFSISDDGGGLGASSGSQDYVRISPVVEQSGTAAYTALKVDVTESALGGTTSNHLLDVQLGNVSKFGVFSTGQIIGDVGSSNVESITITGTPAGSGNVRFAFYNNSTGNSKTQFTFGGTLDAHRWAIGNDITANNVQNFFLYDAAANNNRLVVDAVGNFVLGGGIGAGAPSSLATLDVRVTTAGTVGQIITGASGQTSDLQRWQDGTPTIVAKLSVSGLLTARGIGMPDDLLAMEWMGAA